MFTHLQEKSISPFHTFHSLQKNSYNILRIFLSANLPLLATTNLQKQIQTNKFIKAHKDPLRVASCANVVYKINCQNCDASYVRQTKQI